MSTAATFPAGSVTAVRGGVVDVAFAEDALPQINEALAIARGADEPLILEVHAHLDAGTVRTIALQATAGLARGTPVRTTGAPPPSLSATPFWGGCST